MCMISTNFQVLQNVHDNYVIYRVLNHLIISKENTANVDCDIEFPEYQTEYYVLISSRFLSRL